jgi:hypothetical protein
MEDVARKGPPKTTLTEWFVANMEFESGRHLTYTNYCKRFTFNLKTKKWKPRVAGSWF